MVAQVHSRIIICRCPLQEQKASPVWGKTPSNASRSSLCMPSLRPEMLIPYIQHKSLGILLAIFAKVVSVVSIRRFR